MAKARLPFLISTGMSTLGEIDEVVKWVTDQGLPLVLLQSTSEYPCPPERVGLNLIPFFKERYRCPVGLSDHSGTIYPGLAATLLGIAVLEVHVTLSREMFGPDNQASITTGELRQLVEGVRFIEKMLANPVDKNILAHHLAPLRNIFTKSVVADVDLAAGTVLHEEHLTLKKPGTGIPASRLKELIGRRLVRNVMKDEMLLEDDLEEVD
jgi:N-acetylneuraminate synthase